MRTAVGSRLASDRTSGRLNPPVPIARRAKATGPMPCCCDRYRTGRYRPDRRDPTNSITPLDSERRRPAERSCPTRDRAGFPEAPTFGKMGYMETNKTTKPQPAELRERAIRLVREQAVERGSQGSAIRRYARSQRRWVATPRHCGSGFDVRSVTGVPGPGRPPTSTTGQEPWSGRTASCAKRTSVPIPKFVASFRLGEFVGRSG